MRDTNVSGLKLMVVAMTTEISGRRVGGKVKGKVGARRLRKELSLETRESSLLVTMKKTIRLE